jgi:hypothetical protein
VIANEILNIPPEGFSKLKHQSLSFIELDEFRGITRVDKILKFVSLHELVPAHQIEIYFILFPLAKHEFSKNLNFGQVLYSLV